MIMIRSCNKELKLIKSENEDLLVGFLVVVVVVVVVVAVAVVVVVVVVLFEDFASAVTMMARMGRASRAFILQCSFLQCWIGNESTFGDERSKGHLCVLVCES